MSHQTFSTHTSPFNSYRLTIVFVAFLFFFGMLQSSPVLAHRGPANEVDNCRIRVGTEKIHFTAYTPTFSQGIGYCQAIPHVGPTDLVFDYEGHKLRKVTVEFEITKEPEGTRIYHQSPQKIKSGTISTHIDFSKYGAGDYLVHVKIMNNGEEEDTHLPFTIGAEVKSSSGLIKILIPAVIIVLVILFMFLKSRSDTHAQEK